MIQSIVLQPLRNGEFIQFIIDFLTIVPAPQISVGTLLCLL